jgi:nitrogen fixation NifU-like protein
LYKERILDHDSNPRNKRWLEQADAESHGSNPVCGDDVLIQIRVGNDRIKEIAFSGRGCAICQTVASMLTELAKGKQLEWVRHSSEEDIFRSLGLGEHRKARVSCKLLGIRALRNAVFNYRNSKRENVPSREPGIGTIRIRATRHES